MYLRWIFFITKKYFFKRKNRHILTSTISVFGISIGVFALLVVLGIMNGLQSGFIQDLIEIQSYHSQIYLKQSSTQNEIEQLTGKIEKIPEITSIIPYMDTNAILKTSEGIRIPIILRGIEWNHIKDDPGFLKHTLISDFILNDNEIIIGSSVANALGLNSNKELQLLTIAEGRTIPHVPASIAVQVIDVYSTGFYDIDKTYCFTSIELLQKLFPSRIPVLGLKVKNPYKQFDVPEIFSDNTIVDQIISCDKANGPYYSALKLEKYSMAFLLFLIIIVVNINIKNSLSRFVYAKRKEISILRAIGAKKQDVLIIFILLGIIIGVLGIAIGSVLGLLFLNNIQNLLLLADTFMLRVFGIITEFSYYDIPTKLLTSEIITIFTFILCSTVYFAISGCKNTLSKEPVEILANE